MLKRLYKKWTTNRPTFFRVPKPRFSLSGIATSLEHFTQIILKVGVLILAIIICLFIYQVFKNQGYTIEAFSVPEALEKDGYNGTIIARKISDEVITLNALASSVKQDSILVQSNIQPEVNLAVMGVGLSLRSISFHLRTLLGRPNKIVGGEITKAGEEYQVVIRMTGYPPQRRQLNSHSKTPKQVIDELLQLGAEAIILNTDPYRMAVVKYRQKKYKESVEIARYMIKNHPQETHWAYLAWGSILEQEGKQEQAAEKFKKAIAVKPDFSLAYVRLGWNYREQGFMEEAIAYMRQACSYEPDNVKWYNSLGWMLHAAQQYEGADSIFEAATLVSPNLPYVWSNWADSKMSRGDVEGGLALVEEAMKMVGENGHGYMVKALGGIAKGDTLGALQHAETAFELDPATPYIKRILATWYYSDKKYEKVIDLYHKAEFTSPPQGEDQKTLNIVAMSYNALEQYDRSFEVIRTAIEIDPYFAPPYSTLAETFAFTNQLDSFYYYLEVALENGLSPDMLIPELPPYDQLEGVARFDSLLAKYRPQLKD